MTGVCVLGSTGSIGVQTLNVVRRNPDRFRVVALVCGGNAELLAKQANEFRPVFVGISDKSKLDFLRGAINYDCEICADPKAQEIAASLCETDVVVAAVVGLKGLRGVLSAINSGKKVALANKETLVACGEYVMRLAKEKNVPILPVDSEHSAVFQCLECGRKADLRRIILTASGGPFRGRTRAELGGITPEQAVRHPNWSMGRKISVDSATMMNKGLEIIEARWLFDTVNVDYIIQPDSIIHSMVEFDDGSIIAQIAEPTMELPISYALTYPERVSCGIPPFDFSKDIRFFVPDEVNFPMPAYAKRALEAGGTMPAILNAANEAAVELFFNGVIGFTDIFDVARKAIDDATPAKYSSAEEIIEIHERTITDVFNRFNYGTEQK